MNNEVFKNIDIKQFEEQDKEFQGLLTDLCDEMDKFDTELIFKVEALRCLPYELAMHIVSKLEYDQKEYLGLLNSFYYNEFYSAMKKKEENGKSQFVNRYSLQKELKHRLYLTDRLLTIGEVDNLIKIVVEQDKEGVSLDEIDNYNGNNKALKQLIRARKFLMTKQNAKNTKILTTKLGKFWLDYAKSYVVDNKKQKREV